MAAFTTVTKTQNVLVGILPAFLTGLWKTTRQNYLYVKFLSKKSILPTSVDIARLRSEALVIAMVGYDSSAGWWNSRNKAFELRTPNQQWVLDWQVVYTYLMGHASR